MILGSSGSGAGNDGQTCAEGCQEEDAGNDPAPAVAPTFRFETGIHLHLILTVAALGAAMGNAMPLTVDVLPRVTDNRTSFTQLNLSEAGWTRPMSSASRRRLFVNWVSLAPW